MVMADQPSIVVIACPVCAASRFEAATSAPGPDDILTCQSCGTKLSYAFLHARAPQTASDAAAPKVPKPARARKVKRAVRKPRRK
jgi:hypothetical protein